MSPCSCTLRDCSITVQFIELIIITNNTKLIPYEEVNVNKEFTCK